MRVTANNCLRVTHNDGMIEPSAQQQGIAMKFMRSGSIKDHNGTLVPYKLDRDADEPSRWVCSLDPHQCSQFTPAGSGSNQAEALRKARKWWHQYDSAE